MDLVKLIGAVIAMAFFLAYIAITDVPANINTYDFSSQLPSQRSLAVF
jgi:hypothetical protein